MQFKTVGNITIPALGAGTHGLGGVIKPEPDSLQDCINIIKQYLDLGLTHIDTSEAYASGFSEQIIGKAIRSFPREKLFITDKVWHTNLNYSAAKHAAMQSLSRLGIDYFDLYMIHKPTENMDLNGTLLALSELKKNGITRNIGVSNFDVAQLKAAIGILGQTKLDAVQNVYNILHQDKQVLSFCQKNDILFIAARPLLKGALPQISLLKTLSSKYEKTIAQIMLNWLTSKQNLVAIFKSYKREHIIQNLGSIGWQMTKEDYSLLDFYQ